MDTGIDFGLQLIRKLGSDRFILRDGGTEPDVDVPGCRKVGHCGYQAECDRGYKRARRRIFYDEIVGVTEQAGRKLKVLTKHKFLGDYITR